MKNPTIRSVLLFSLLIPVCAVLLSCGRSVADESIRTSKDSARSSYSNAAYGLQDIAIAHGGRDRNFLLYAPNAAKGKQNIPLIIVLHCGGCDASRMLGLGMNRLADRDGYLVVYPNGTARKPRKGHLTWNAGGIPPVGYAEKKDIDDVGFIRAVIANIKHRYNVDKNRIYVTGVSKGGMLAYRLACEMPDEIAAIAPVAATMEISYDQCKVARRVPLLHIHGTADRNVPLAGGKDKYSARKANYRAVKTVLEYWRKESACSERQETSYRKGDASCMSYVGCDDDAEVTLCLVEGGGHVWPGPDIKANERQLKKGEYISPNLDATGIIWQFFSHHRLGRN